MAIKIVVPVSGGKDSQACLKLALQEYKPDEILGLFCDTKFEHPLTYKHIDWMSEFYGVEIKTISGGSVEDKIKKYKRFPTDAQRFCTDELKIRESRIFYEAFAREQSGFEVWYGMRTSESKQREKRYSFANNSETYLPNDFQRKFPKKLGKLGVKFRLPIVDWCENEIKEFVGKNELNPLYAAGFPRVGCFPCLASGDKWKSKAFNFDETGKKHYKMCKELEPLTGFNIYTSKKGQLSERNNDIFNGCSFCAI